MLSVPHDTVIGAYPPALPEEVISGQPPDDTSANSDISISKFSTYRAHSGEIFALVVSKDGKSAVSGGADGKVVLTSFGTKRGADNAGGGMTIYSELLLQGPKPVLSLALSPDERLLAISQPHLISIFDLRKREFVYKLSQIKGRALSMAWDPLGEFLALGLANGDIYVWNIKRTPAAGKDTMDAIEEYTGGLSPIVGLAFHPSARAFFSVEADGTVALWRLLRAEYEIGLRDRYSLVDEKQIASTPKSFARVKTRVKDVWLKPDGQALFVAAASGSVYRWKVRGLALRNSIPTGGDVVSSLAGMSIEGDRDPGQEVRRVPVLATAGRGQRLQFWCSTANFGEGKILDPGVDVLASEMPVGQGDFDLNPTETYGLEGVDTDVSASKVRVGVNAMTSDLDAQQIAARKVDPESKHKFGFIAETGLFSSPISIIRTGANSSILWAAQKTGNLLIFDSNSLRNSPVWEQAVNFCKDSLHETGEP